MTTEQPFNTGAGLYSHDETVAAITSYYEFVSRAHAISVGSKLLHPPPEGWPQLTADCDVVACLGLNDEALHLIRHIPYFEFSDSLHILPDVQPKSYIDDQRLMAAARQRSSGEPERASNSEEEDLGRPPPHLVLLGHVAEGREYGHDAWLDTKLGNVVMGNYHRQARPDIGGIPEDGNDPNPDDHSYDNLFRAYGSGGEGCVWRIGTFFAACERNLRELVWMPGMDEGDGGWILADEGESPYAMLDYEHRKRIMRDNGWPGDGWNPDGVVEELDRLLIPTEKAEDEAKGGQ
ncbi:hypothetical protein F4820DRAFT_8721 [Hypoxylon rubiginosum]|uniref:Uncharacterized protein n=1 Tax=Hypoxylon rubiginosum TaxID=110542 RepID=A0ACB9ZJ79_9PEZI|nr:hypothetical protein F4820DRAFT_8721 [Hypoxylon rubiginosum]